MTFTSSKCVHHLAQTSILLGKLIDTKESKKKFGCTTGSPRPMHGASINMSLNNWLTTHLGSLFHTMPYPRERVQHGHVKESRWDTPVHGPCVCPWKKIFSCVRAQETQWNHRTKTLLWVWWTSSGTTVLSTPKKMTGLGDIFHIVYVNSPAWELICGRFEWGNKKTTSISWW